MDDKSLTLASILIMRHAYWGNKFAELIFDETVAPGLNMTDFIKEKIKNDPNYTKPQGMPDVNSKGEYPETQEPSDAPYKPPEGMPDYTPDPNKPAPEDNSYTKPEGMPDYSPGDGGTGAPIGGGAFGDQTVLKSGKKAKNGFEALKEFDENRNGKIDSQDAIWKFILAG